MIDWNDIDTKGKTKGQIKVKCPSCIDTRSNKRDTSLSVNLDQGIAKCHYCEEISIRDKQETKFDLPKQDWSNFTILSDQIVKYFEEQRAISQKTLLDCKITEEKYYQPALGKEVNNIVFNYFEGDTLVNKKYRSGNKKFTQSKNTKNIFYGINDIINESEVYIVEGEMDKLALWEIGIKNCISVPNGANDNDDVWKNSEKYLTEDMRFIICTDQDEKGNNLAEKIAQRLGRYRCERVELKNKDANEDLIEGVLKETIKNTKKYPVSGTLGVLDLSDEIDKLYENGLPETIKTKSKWLCGVDDIFSVMRGHLITGTGIPSHGKSTFTDWYVMNLIATHKIKASWYSPEHSPMELHQSNFAQLFIGKSFFGSDRMSKSELELYKEWANEKIYVTYTEKGKKPTWNWLLDTFKHQLYRYGIDVFVIDAFNKVLFDKSGNKKDLIDEILTELTSFCQVNNVMIFLVAHPTKMSKNDQGEYECPTLYDVSGSADFRNQTHDGFAIHRIFPNEVKGELGHTIFQNLKTKFKFQGEIGGRTNLNYHLESGRLYCGGYIPGYLVEPENKEKEFDYPTDWDFN